MQSSFIKKLGKEEILQFCRTVGKSVPHFKCNLLKKGSPTKITISQLPEIPESFIETQIKGFDGCYSFMII